MSPELRMRWQRETKNNWTPRGQGEAQQFFKREVRLLRLRDSNQINQASGETPYVKLPKTNISRLIFSCGVVSTQKAMTFFFFKVLEHLLYITQVFMI